MKKQIVFSVIIMFSLILSFFLVSFVIGQPVLDPSIEKLLEGQGEVLVMVNLNHDITSNYSPSIKDPAERTRWLVDIMKQVEEIQNKIIPNLRDDEFQIKHIFELSPSFSGNITKEGFKKLSINPNVESITKVERIYGTSLETQILKGSINCQEDLECVPVSLTCCSCSKASINTPIEDVLTTINKGYLDLWNDNFENLCQDAICGQGFNEMQIKRCDSYSAKCISNLCVLVNLSDGNMVAEPDEEILIKKGQDFSWTLILIGIAVILIILLFIKLMKNEN